MRITVISHTYTVGLNRGKFSCFARDFGGTVQLIVPERWEEAELRRVICAEREENERYCLAPLPFTGSRRTALKRYPFGLLRRRVRRCAPQVVHVEEEPWSLAALQAALVARECKVPLTLFTWENLDRRLPPPFRLINRFVLRQTHHLMVGNTAAEAVARKRGYRGPVTRIPQLGVDPELFRPAADMAPTAGRGLQVGFVGRLVRAKGVELLLEAFAQLPQQHRLLWVGDGPLGSLLQARARECGCADRVTFAGSASHREVAGHLQAMDVLVLPSITTPRWREQFGHVLIEAMACGLPVVGSDSGAIPEVVGDAGLIVPEGNVAALVAALSELADNKRRTTLGARGVERVREQYTDRAIAGQLARVFERLDRRMAVEVPART